MVLSKLAKNLLYLRKRNKWTQAEMPDRCNVKTTTWSNWENGVSEPSASKIIEISDLFELPIDYILRYDLEKNVHLIEEWQEKKGKKITSLYPYPTFYEDTLNVVNEPVENYGKEFRKEVELLILKQLNDISDDVRKLTDKLL